MNELIQILHSKLIFMMVETPLMISLVFFVFSKVLVMIRLSIYFEDIRFVPLFLFSMLHFFGKFGLCIPLNFHQFPLSYIIYYIYILKLHTLSHTLMFPFRSLNHLIYFFKLLLEFLFIIIDWFRSFQIFL